MTCTVKQWGNSVGVVIPKPIARRLGLSPGTAVSISERADSVVFRKASRRPRRTLDHIVRQITPGSYKAMADWDEDVPAGKEVW